MKTILISIIALIFIISCVAAQTPKTGGSKPESDQSRETARVPGQLSGETDTILAPARVAVDTDFEVTVKTGGNGCWNKGDASVVLGDNAADIFVYDLTNATRPGTMCTMIYKQFDHKVTLRFAEKGEAVIRVWARGAGDGPMGKPVIIEKRVIVK
jgi:hypothetical protein